MIETYKEFKNTCISLENNNMGDEYVKLLKNKINRTSKALNKYINTFEYNKNSKRHPILKYKEERLNNILSKETDILYKELDRTFNYIIEFEGRQDDYGRLLKIFNTIKKSLLDKINK